MRCEWTFVAIKRSHFRGSKGLMTTCGVAGRSIAECYERPNAGIAVGLTRLEWMFVCNQEIKCLTRRHSREVRLNWRSSLHAMSTSDFCVALAGVVDVSQFHLSYHISDRRNFRERGDRSGDLLLHESHEHVRFLQLRVG
jgi:hypothetical protein